MKKLGLFLMVSVTAAAALMPSRGAGQTFPGPDGLIAYSADLAAGRTICAVHPDGGEPFRLTDPDQNARDPAWSPGGDELLFTGGTDDNQRIFRMPAFGFGAGAVEVTSGRVPTWSPDGTKIAFYRDGAIYTANADGSDEQLLVNGGYDPVWSPDGTQIAFEDDLRDGNTHDDGGIYLVAADGNGEPRYLSGGYEPSWSPDGSEIAVRNSYFAESIGVIDVDTGQYREVAFSEDHHHSHPTWSPDGEKIAFVILNLDGDRIDDKDIDVFPADESLGETHRIHSANPDFIGGVSWQPVVEPITPSTGRAIPCVDFPYERSVSLRLKRHLIAKGRVVSLDPNVNCHSRVPVTVNRRKDLGVRVFGGRTDRDGYYRIKLSDKPGRYFAAVPASSETECVNVQSLRKSHSH